MYQVAIILSTYNGERYIGEQLESLGNQTYGDIDVFIHDDGSSDNTMHLVNNFIKNYSGNVRFYVCQNRTGLGYPACFIDTLKDIQGYSYYAFCDQDDIWNLDKVQRAVEHIKNENGNIPLLYYSSVDYYDEMMRFIRHSRFASSIKGDVNRLGLQEFLLGGEPLGMTYLINDCTKEKIVELYNKGYTSYKDGFIKLLCASCGKVIYDPEPSAKYRRHSSATTALANPSSKVKRYLKMVNKLFTDQKELDEWQLVLKTIKKEFSTEILPENQKLVSLFCGDRNIKNQIKKILWNKRFRTLLIDEVGYRLLFLMGKL